MNKNMCEKIKGVKWNKSRYEQLIKVIGELKKNKSIEKFVPDAVLLYIMIEIYEGEEINLKGKDTRIELIKKSLEFKNAINGKNEEYKDNYDTKNQGIKERLRELKKLDIIKVFQEEGKQKNGIYEFNSEKFALIKPNGDIKKIIVENSQKISFKYEEKEYVYLQYIDKKSRNKALKYMVDNNVENMNIDTNNDAEMLNRYLAVEMGAIDGKIEVIIKKSDKDYLKTELEDFKDRVLLKEEPIVHFERTSGEEDYYDGQEIWIRYSYWITAEGKYIRSFRIEGDKKYGYDKKYECVDEDFKNYKKLMDDKERPRPFDFDYWM